MPDRPIGQGSFLTSSTSPTGLVKVIRAKKIHGAKGFDVLGPNDVYTHFAQDWTCHLAVVGENVCEQPKGTHWCGLTHVPADMLMKLPRKEA